MKNSTNNLPFEKQNFILLIISIIVVLLGYTIMSIDSQEFGFGFLGLTLGPIITLIGLIIGIFSILWKPRK